VRIYKDRSFRGRTAVVVDEAGSIEEDQPSGDERPIVTWMGHIPDVDPKDYVDVARAKGWIPAGAVILTGALVDAATAVWNGVSADQAATKFGVPVDDVELAATQLKRRA
jgi:hypothetical protein